MLDNQSLTMIMCIIHLIIKYTNSISKIQKYLYNLKENSYNKKQDFFDINDNEIIMIDKYCI